MRSIFIKIGSLYWEYNGNFIPRLRDTELGTTYLDLWLGIDPLDEDLKLSLMGITTIS